MPLNGLVSGWAGVDDLSQCCVVHDQYRFAALFGDQHFSNFSQTFRA